MSEQSSDINFIHSLGPDYGLIADAVNRPLDVAPSSEYRTFEMVVADLNAVRSDNRCVSIPAESPSADPELNRAGELYIELANKLVATGKPTEVIRDYISVLDKDLNLNDTEHDTLVYRIYAAQRRQELAGDNVQIEFKDTELTKSAPLITVTQTLTFPEPAIVIETPISTVPAIWPAPTTPAIELQPATTEIEAADEDQNTTDALFGQLEAVLSESGSTVYGTSDNPNAAFKKFQQELAGALRLQSGMNAEKYEKLKVAAIARLTLTFDKQATLEALKATGNDRPYIIVDGRPSIQPTSEMPAPTRRHSPVVKLKPVAKETQPKGPNLHDKWVEDVLVTQREAQGEGFDALNTLTILHKHYIGLRKNKANKSKAYENAPLAAAINKAIAQEVWNKVVSSDGRDPQSLSPEESKSLRERHAAELITVKQNLYLTKAEAYPTLERVKNFGKRILSAGDKTKLSEWY